MGATHHASLENRWCSQGRCDLNSGQGSQACKKHFFASSCFEVARQKHGQSQESLQAWSTQQSCQGAAWQSLWQHSSGESLGPRIGQAARHARGLGAAADFQSTVAAASAANDPACRRAHRQKWAAYRSRFIEPRRIDAGVQFWRQHEAALQRAEKTYGVPAHYIVGILGVETYFGQHQGQFKVVDALATLSLAFPKEHKQASEREAFFKNELGTFLQQRLKNPCMKNQLGSYAGAIGWPQFMPSSIAKFAVDFDNDGRIDLAKSSTDAIGSIANYFQAYGWQTGMPTHFDGGHAGAGHSP
jgi:membrane-bound lytic murein transglycosylase B